MAFPKLGQEVILVGTITGVFCTETTEPSRQAFNVRLKDGQAVHTNIDNLYFYEEPQVTESPIEIEETTADELSDRSTADVSEPDAPVSSEPNAGDPEPASAPDGPVGAGETDTSAGAAATPADDPSPEPAA